MLLLVTDTSGRNGSVALARADEGSNEVHIMESAPLTGGTFSAQLVPQIDALLTKHGFSKTQIEAFIVVSGPGSFTGLRVGLAAIKALGEILAKPIVSVSLLEVLAWPNAGSGKVMSAMDAGRGEIFAGEYEFTNANRVIREQLLSKEEFLESACKASVVTADQKIADLARDAGLTFRLVDTISSGVITRLGWKKLRAGETVDPVRLDANYIRRTDAEIFANPPSKS
jgi:tRNA threonylcarbamoyladenosine biosynthesis protein TsaB